MLDEIYEWDDSITEDDYYDALYYLLGDAYPRLSDNELEDLLQDILDTLPEEHVESILDTIGNIGKNIGSGGLKVLASNPQLLKYGATAAGGFIGGPVGAQIGNKAGNYASNLLPKKPLPEIGKTLALMQNPQVQAAVARPLLGIEHGVSPLNLNGVTQYIPSATYLRAVIDSAQKALKELDAHNIIPPAAFSEALPYSDDVDRQAEWLAEQLVG